MDRPTLHALRQQDRTALQNILTALNGAQNALRRDPCGEWVIQGSRGYIRVHRDQFAIYIACRSTRAWTSAKKQLSGITLLMSQDGDDEGVIVLSRTPNRAEAAHIRHYIGLRQTRDAPANPFRPK